MDLKILGKNLRIEYENNMDKYYIITKEYYSNCILEALKAKIKHPFKVKLFVCKPIISKGHFQNIHFMWSDGNNDYDFFDLEEIPSMRCFINYILFKGVIRKFDLGFAKKYSSYRNRRCYKN